MKLIKPFYSKINSDVCCLIYSPNQNLIPVSVCCLIYSPKQNLIPVSACCLIYSPKQNLITISATHTDALSYDFITVQRSATLIEVF